MNNNIQVFDFKGEQVRTLTDQQGEPWFVAKDVCDVLGIATNHLRESLEDDELSEITNLPNTEVGSNGGRAPLIVSEAGLYSLVLRSRKPEAREFKRCVTHEVLPKIRKHGGYLTPQKVEEVLSDPDTIIRLATNLKEERSKRLEAERAVEAQKPKVLFADSVAASHTTILVGDLAKILKGNGIDIGGNRLFQWLRDNGYLIRRKGTDYNMPTQKSMELGLFFIKETNVQHSDGHITVNKTPKITGKGQQYFVNKFLGKEVKA
ncbi:phage antirepressor [Bifidobacterium oedipodis]|uniref:Phage antirepressor protein n=1 Tax=Bifidobacterium oedipodis TaxID=2675322 RepID=A0A7Y0EPA6_9BIFI|nr:phage antirepressor KilAC domain-containing protein [Bifidobacterium sp. DSM 109957]NMM93942.1 phage antirepressor protein [Bifidobacterium sp. DSM 109957]